MDDFDWLDDEDDDRTRCPQCGEVVPESHLETDSGVCIGCEDAENAEDGE